jgi:hypothetical protein
MMYWGNTGMNGWGYALMSFSTVLLWVLIITGIVLLVRYLGDNRPKHGTGRLARASPRRSSPSDLRAVRWTTTNIAADSKPFEVRTAHEPSDSRAPGSRSTSHPRTGASRHRPAGPSALTSPPVGGGCSI